MNVSSVGVDTLVAGKTHLDNVAPEIHCVDLFCGVGGLTHGLIRGGIRVVAGIDIDPQCRFPYESNNDTIGSAVAVVIFAISIAARRHKSFK
jgi:site-specific DNA-cytosine methylase